MASGLHQAIAHLLPPKSWPSLSFLAVARGPGSFTSTRLGMVTARTLAQQLEIPLFSVSSLAAIAHRQWQQGEVGLEQAIALDLRAQRGQRFTALYGSSDGLPQAIIPDQVCSPEQWEQQLAQQFTPRSAPLHRLNLGDQSEQADQANPIAAAVDSLWSMAQQRYLQGERPGWLAALPFYGQHPVVLQGQPPGK